MIEDTWPIVEIALHRWVRESTGIPGAQVYWPTRGKPRPDPPSALLHVTGERDFTRAGSARIRSAQPVSWLVTLTAGPGTHTIDLLGPDSDTPLATATTTQPGGTSIEDARDALLADAVAEFTDLDVAASGTDSILLTGTASLMVFHPSVSVTLSGEIIASPDQVIRRTSVETVLTVEFRSSETAGSGTARLLAKSAKLGMRDFDALLERVGWRFGSVLEDRPGFEDDLTESRHVLSVQLLGQDVDIRGPVPWVRKARATLTAGGTTTTALAPE